MVLKEESIRILKTINQEWSTDIDHEETIAPLSISQEFIYPSVAKNLNLTFKKKWYADSISECKYTMDDEIKKYLFCCHNKKSEPYGHCESELVIGEKHI